MHQQALSKPSHFHHTDARSTIAAAWWVMGPWLTSWVPNAAQISSTWLQYYAWPFAQQVLAALTAMPASKSPGDKGTDGDLCWQDAFPTPGPAWCPSQIPPSLPCQRATGPKTNTTSAASRDRLRGVERTNSAPGSRFQRNPRHTYLYRNSGMSCCLHSAASSRCLASYHATWCIPLKCVLRNSWRTFLD